ncbi:DUF5076 domain-containing protein [Neoaquamicrobium sediminum]|uniref:DUF5076 domain-containing protein n=1 Tax=Neoaquamicrobium sediminum TaxID=1849104 RepID=A0ABV3WTM6_9HYPH
MSNDLDVPDEVAGDPTFDEVLRVWIAQDSVVTMRNIFGPEGNNWGMVIADVAVHIARMRLEQDDIPMSETFAAIESGYQGRMSDYHHLNYSSLSRKH